MDPIKSKQASGPLTARTWDASTQAARSARRSRRRGWLTTPPHLIAGARVGDARAVSSLCARYRLSVRAYLQQRGVPRDLADDVTQGFFEDLLTHQYFFKLDPDGRFGAWLRAGAWNHLRNVRKRASAKMRLIDDNKATELRSQLEERQAAACEHLLDRRRVLVLLDAAWERLRPGYESSGRGQLFEHLRKTFLDEPTALNDAQLSRALGYSDSYVAVARHHLIKREIAPALKAELEQRQARGEAIGSAITVRGILKAMIDALA